MENLIQRDKRVIWHPYTQMKTAPDPIPIVKGKGVYLIDDKGNSLIDAISSWWVNIHGHAHPHLAKKIYEQAQELEHVLFAGFTHEPAVQLAERLLPKLPGTLDKLFYSDNGSTAVEVALKMAIQYWKNKGETKRNKILAFTNSYHGDTFGAMSISERGIFTLAFHDYLFEVLFIDTPQNNTLPESLLYHQDWENIACFIYEPLVQGAGGMKMYDAEGLNSLLEICKRHQIICIADEVMTGFGRTGKVFASEYMQQKPDIVCLSKGLTGGMMAMGATVCTKEIYNAFLSDDKNKTFFHGHSYTANPLACSAGLASLDLLEKEECSQCILLIEESNKQFITELQYLSINDRRIKNIRQLGTILAFELTTEGKDGYLNTISPIISKKALEQGVLLRPLGNTIYIMPPYCITKEELNKVYKCILNVINTEV